MFSQSGVYKYTSKDERDRAVPILIIGNKASAVIIQRTITKYIEILFVLFLAIRFSMLFMGSELKFICFILIIQKLIFEYD